jgi:uncharacterized repeat protein (TIGR03803 family)
MTPGGTFTTIYAFCSQEGCVDGSYPDGVIEGLDGNLYGMTAYGGTGYSCTGGLPVSGCGTAYKLTTDGVLTTIYGFCAQGDCVNGAYPGALMQATDGNLYGGTGGGGDYGSGTAFRLTPTGTLTTLNNFDDSAGANAVSQWIQFTTGKIYGTSSLGGNDACIDGCGTIFGLSIGSGAFVTTVLDFGKVGSAVEILGTHLAGASSVTFNGTSANFTVSQSGTYISTSVPAGATTGPIQVVTPSGTLTSNVNFQVLP